MNKTPYKNARSTMALILLLLSANLFAQQRKTTAASAGKPNILVIFGDDIGVSCVSAYSMGLMGFKTPNIDRIAREGILFTDYYGQQSCTAGPGQLS